MWSPAASMAASNAGLAIESTVMAVRRSSWRCAAATAVAVIVGVSGIRAPTNDCSVVVAELFVWVAIVWGGGTVMARLTLAL